MSTYNWLESVPWWATMTVFCDGENPTYPVRRLREYDSGPGQLWLYPTKLCCAAIASGRHGLEVGVCFAVGWKGIISTSGVQRPASDAQPQLQLSVVEGSQYAVLANWVNGANDAIWPELSGVIA